MLKPSLSAWVQNSNRSHRQQGRGVYQTCYCSWHGQHGHHSCNWLGSSAPKHKHTALRWMFFGKNLVANWCREQVSVNFPERLWCPMGDHVMWSCELLAGSAGSQMLLPATRPAHPDPTSRAFTGAYKECSVPASASLPAWNFHGWWGIGTV